jgi:ATP-binding protein involved in chromosome partitioning
LTALVRSRIHERSRRAAASFLEDPMSAPTASALREALRDVRFEPSPKSVVELDLVHVGDVRDGAVVITLELPSPSHPQAEELARRVRAAALAVEGVREVRIDATWKVRAGESKRPALPGVKHLVAVASGKGGVGKSTVASNLAVGLARLGASTGLLDLDIYGPSVPVVMGEAPEPRTDGERLLPSEAHGLRFLSMGQLAPGDRPVLWRGPMLHKMVTQLAAADWGTLDYLVLDLPPGTGDVQLTLTQAMPVTGAIVVTTPQEIALIDARKGLAMFRDAHIPLLGIVENMAWYDCRRCGKRHAIFGADGGRRLAEQENVPLLAQLPLDLEVMRAADAGRPIASDDATPAGRAYRALAVDVAAALGAMSLSRSPFRVLA